MNAAHSVSCGGDVGEGKRQALSNIAARAYLVAGIQEPFFLGNATKWAEALRNAGADVVMHERVGSHGGAFWREEFPLMLEWAFGPRGQSHAPESAS